MFWRPEKTYCYSDSSEKSSVRDGVKNLQGIIMIIIIIIDTRRKGNLQILENIGSGHHQTSEDERKNLKRVHQENEETSENQTIEQKSNPRDKHRGCPPCQILGTILEEDERTSAKGPENRKTHDIISLRWRRLTVCFKNRRRKRIRQHWR